MFKNIFFLLLETANSHELASSNTFPLPENANQIKTNSLRRLYIPTHPEINFRANSGNRLKPIRNPLNIFINPLGRIFAFRRGIYSPD
jgi:hypothetical protein